MSEGYLHLMTQRDQPYGSQRRCCECCGVMIWPQYQADQTPPYTTDPDVYAKATNNCSTRCRDES